ncbi:MAG: hypothetical protein ACLU0O_06325 [Collinsella sp.]
MNAAKDCTCGKSFSDAPWRSSWRRGTARLRGGLAAYAAPSTVDVSIGGKIPYGGFATDVDERRQQHRLCAELVPAPAAGSCSTGSAERRRDRGHLVSFGSPGFDASMFPGSWYDGGGWDERSTRRRAT